MDTDRLRQFCVIVESGSMTQAASLLGISLSGLSKSMKQLQDDLGYEVLQPDGRGLIVTDLGREVYRKAHSIIEHVQQLGSLQNEQIQSLRVGGVEVFTHSFLSRVLHQEFPESVIEVSDLKGGEIERALLENKIDVGVTYFPQPQEGVDYLKIKSTTLKIFVKKSNSLPEFNEDLRFVLPLSINSPEVTEMVDRDGWPDFRIPRRKGLKTNRLSTAISLVLNSDYAIFIPQFLANELNTQLKPNLQLVELSGNRKFSKVKRDIFLVKRKSSPEDRLIKVLAKHIRKEC